MGVLYQFFGSFGTAAEGAEEEDGDGAGKENASGDLEGRRVVVRGENGGSGRWEFDGSFVLVLWGGGLG